MTGVHSAESPNKHMAILTGQNQVQIHNDRYDKHRLEGTSARRVSRSVHETLAMSWHHDHRLSPPTTVHYNTLNTLTTNNAQVKRRIIIIFVIPQVFSIQRI